jgi:hypothetical protein
MPARLRLPVLSGTWLRASIAPALVFIATATDRHYLADFWHHLARGRAIVTEGRLVNTDLFTYTVAGRPFQDVNWLSQVLYYHLYGLGGLPLVQCANAFALAAMMGLLLYLCRRASGSLATANLVCILAFFGLWEVFTVRPQTFSFVLFAGLYGVLWLAERRPWLLVLPPALLALWANVHGAFPAGLLLVGAFVLGAAYSAWRRDGWRVWRDRTTRRLALCLVGCVLATMLNPYGWRVYAYVGATSSSAAARGIDEWLPPSLDLLIGKAWAVSLAVVLTAFALPRSRPTAREVCLALVFLPLACGSVRMVAWWLLAMAPVLARLLADNLAALRALDRPEPPSFASAAVFGAVVLAVVFCLPGLDCYNPLLGAERRSGRRPEDDLEAAARYVADHAATGRVFCRFEWGEYLGWALGPRQAVFMDGRIEIFPDDVWARYSTVTRAGAGWRDVLASYRVDCLLLDRQYHARTGLLAQVERCPEWQPALQVGDAVLFLRQPRLALVGAAGHGTMQERPAEPAARVSGSAAGATGRAVDGGRGHVAAEFDGQARAHAGRGTSAPSTCGE